MSQKYRRQVLRAVVGHCGNTIGWNGIQSSSLDLLADVMERYIVEIGRHTHRYCEQCEFSPPSSLQCY